MKNNHKRIFSLNKGKISIILIVIIISIIIFSFRKYEEIKHNKIIQHEEYLVQQEEIKKKEYGNGYEIYYRLSKLNISISVLDANDIYAELTSQGINVNSLFIDTNNYISRIIMRQYGENEEVIDKLNEDVLQNLGFYLQTGPYNISTVRRLRVVEQRIRRETMENEVNRIVLTAGLMDWFSNSPYDYETNNVLDRIINIKSDLIFSDIFCENGEINIDLITNAGLIIEDKVIKFME